MNAFVSKNKSIVASRAIEPKFFSAPWPEWGQFEPSPYQHAGVEYRIGRRHGLFGDAPGLGKSAEALLFGNSIGAEYTLIVCPASLRLNWEREVKLWTTIENVSTYPVLKSKDGVSLEHNFVIISYDLLRNNSIMDALLDERWDHLILDEAHALKDPKGNKRTRAICAPDMLPSVVDRISMLTGTPMPNQPIEIYNAIRLLDHSIIDNASLETFREEYYEEGEGWVRGPVLVSRETHDGKQGCSKCDDLGVLNNGIPCNNCVAIEPYYISKQYYSTHVRNRPVNLDDLQYRLRKGIMVRRLKEDVLTQLPPKQWHPFPIEPDAAIRKALKHPGWTKVNKLYEMDPARFDITVPVDGAVSTAMRLLGEAKAPIVAEYIKELLEEGVEKILVAAWHRNPSDEGVAGTRLSVLHYLQRELREYGVAYMDGGTTPRKKQDAVDNFQNCPEIRVIIGQLSTIGEGWTLTKAQDAVFAEFYWVPGKNDQLLDRLHRRGQEGGYVIGHMPLIPGSMDERVVGTAVNKDRNIYQALDAQN